ncbi:MAG TPA: Crp/Fnr family transcriptional regulator [Sphingomicrobium sp.]|nr:Crp/Fnr family transcriptional regulator [Sphingomicrobium sp.]
MALAEIDLQDRIDQAFAGNRLLATFSAEARVLLEPEAEIVELGLGDVILERGRQVASSLFPFGSTMISMVVDVDGRSIEVASVGDEGAVGGIISCGHAPAYTRAAVLVAGPALRLPMEALEKAKSQSGFIANLFCRYSDFLLAQVMQGAACNVFHSIQARTARWLLTAQDRAGDRLELTQEALAGLLGAQRTTVNAAVRSLQELGLVEIRRGAIHITDRDGLRRIACECYDRLESHFNGVIGPKGVGGG